MRISVVITCHNYGHFLGDCLDSVLGQTCPPDEIVVVNDGSTDNSAALLDAFARKHPSLRPLHQKNAGHLAALDAGFAASTGELIFLLDADDRYLPHHIASVSEAFRLHQPDLVCTAYRLTGAASGDVFRYRQSGLLGCAAIAALQKHLWVAGQTSVLAFRRSLGNRLFPYPPHWFTHGVQTGEAGIVLGASILGARQYYLRDVQVEYRVHDSNFDARKQHDPQTAHRIHRLCHEIAEHYRLRAGLPWRFCEEALAEFRTWPHPGKTEWACYRSLLWNAPLPWPRKIEHLWRAYRHYWKQR